MKKSVAATATVNQTIYRYYEYCLISYIGIFPVLQHTGSILQKKMMMTKKNEEKKKVRLTRSARNTQKSDKNI